jgi:hypothetical protein
MPNPTKKKSFSEFFLKASKKEQIKVFTQAAKMANKDQGKEFEDLELYELPPNAYTHVYALDKHGTHYVAKPFDLKKLLAQQQSVLLERVKELVEQLRGYTEHSGSCIRFRSEAGRPTVDGGYEQMFDGKWYQASPVDKTPKCECGLITIIQSLDSLIDKN